jgi:DNA repair exonuclease SbcCD ATPase subunit
MVNVNPTDKLVFDLKMLQIDYNEQKKESLKKEISEKYDVPLKNIEINFIPITVDSNGDRISLTSDIIENIQDPNFQLDLFKEYMDIKDIQDVDFEEIKKIDAQVNAFVDFDQYSKYKLYKFKYVKWSNYLSYGKDNYFDFTKLHGLVLLNGEPENQSGKTTFAIDLLRFALFGKAQKSPNLESVFNVYHPEETEVMVEAGIEINGVDYVIRRTVTRPALSKRTKKSKAKQKLEYFKLINGNYELIENCEGETGAETNNIIRESVGSVDDYNLVISATSKTLADLLDMGQTDKGKLFSRWLGLLTIEKKEEIAKDLWKKKISPVLFSNTYNKATIESEINDYDACIKGNNDEIVKSQTKLNESNERINILNNDKVKILTNRKEIKEELIKLDVTTIENKLASNNTDLANYRAQMAKYKEGYKLVKDAKFDDDEYKKTKETIEVKKTGQKEYSDKNIEIKVKIGQLRNDTKRIEKLIEDKVCPTCGHPIELDEQKGFIDKNKKSENELIEEGKKNKEQIDSIQTEIDNLNKSVADMEVQRENLRKKSELELRMTAIKSNIDNIKLRIADLQRQKNEIETNKDNIKYNNEIDLKIRNLDESIKTETIIKEQLIKEIESYKNETKNYEKEIEKRNVLIAKLVEEEKIIRNWTIYQQLVGKNGIVKIVLKRALPIINNEIARILDGLCDFEVKLSISDDGKVCMDLIRDGISLDLGTSASGFESVMASLAIRHALASLASLSKPNFTTFDEILDGVAVSNYENVRQLYKRTVDNYDFILHITHNELISDWHDTVITVVKDLKENVSKIELK